jgi:predicted DNA-binding transcriptional regulator YafY
MNRIDRLTAILTMLQSRRLVKAASIAERFEISLRTVYRDVRALQEIGVPVNGEAGLGYFLMEGYKLPPIIFSKEEAGALLLSQKLVEKLTDQSLQKHFSQAIDKIRAVLKTVDKDWLENVEEGVRFMGSFDSEKPIDGNYMIELQNAIAERKTVNIDYISEGQIEALNRDVEPMGLVFYGNRWHLIGFCRLRQDYRDFRLDRIEKLDVTGKHYKMSAHKKIDQYLEELTNRHELILTVVRFPKNIAKYIGSQKYYHGFVSEKTFDNIVEMEFMLPDLEYFSRWLLLFTGEVEILSPEVLKERVYQHVNKLQKKYLKLV